MAEPICLTLTANGAFTFAATVMSGASYAITVSTQPTGQTCTVANANGSNVMADVTNVNVACASPSRYAYVVNNGDNTVSAYTIGAQGELAALGTATAPELPRNR